MQTMTASTGKSECLYKRVQKWTISYSQNVIWSTTWPIYWWPWKFNLHSESLNELCSLRSLQNKVYRPDSLLAQANGVTLASMELSIIYSSTELGLLSLHCRSSPFKSTERALDFKGLWMMSGVPCLLPTGLVILQITMYIHIQCHGTYWPGSGTGNISVAVVLYFCIPGLHLELVSSHLEYFHLVFSPSVYLGLIPSSMLSYHPHTPFRSNCLKIEAILDEALLEKMWL